jgi:uncharacterized membrane protein YfcA
MLAHFDLLTLLAGALVCFLAGVVGGLSGFGTGILVALFITPLVGPKALIPLMAVVMLINNASRVWFFRRGLDLRISGTVLLTAIPSAYLGVKIYQHLQAPVLQLIIGLVIAISIPLKYWLRKRPTPTGWLTLHLFGAAYGVLSSVVVGAGMVIMPALLGFGLAGPALVATDALIAVGINVAKAIFFQRLEALDLALALFGMCAGLATVPGVALASKISERLGVKIHTRIVEALVVVGGLHMGYKGWLT